MAVDISAESTPSLFANSWIPCTSAIFEFKSTETQVVLDSPTYPSPGPASGKADSIVLSITSSDEGETDTDDPPI